MRLIKPVEPEAMIPIPIKVVELAPYWIEKLDNSEESSRPAVTEEDVADIVAMVTGIPLANVAESETEKLLHMNEELKKSIVGQNDAIEQLARATQRARAGLKNPKRPIGSFMFLGPTGGGKTELAKVLSKYLFTNNESFIRIDSLSISSNFLFFK